MMFSLTEHFHSFEYPLILTCSNNRLPTVHAKTQNQGSPPSFSELAVHSSI